MTTVRETRNAATVFMSPASGTVGVNARSAPVSCFRVLRSSLSRQFSHPHMLFHGFAQFFQIKTWTLH